MNSSFTIRLTDAVARNPQIQLSKPVNLSLPADGHIAIVGPNACGKTLLTDMMTGKSPLVSGRIEYDFTPLNTQSAYQNIRYIAFRDTYGSYDANYYYQQRWNAGDQGDIPTVREQLGSVENITHQHRLFSLFGINDLIDKPIIQLSSGELRKFQLVRALLTSPRILIIDNPFIGLDASTRVLLTRLLGDLSKMGTIQLILVVSMLDDVPPFITHVIPVGNRCVGSLISRAEWLKKFQEEDVQKEITNRALYEDLKERIASLPAPADDVTPNDEIIRLQNVSICYGRRTILKDLDWVVHRNEKWILSGENGAGKSTLLSLICADNPQSYACDISLFGRKRGSGESIWEIKRHIGYVSPEMHRAYLKNLPTIDIVASGLHDSIGLYRRPCPEQIEICLFWMDIFGIASLKDTSFLQLSSGEQRLALLARAFVKDPSLLILDEPLHGLDTFNRRRIKHIIEAFCQRPNKTLIMVTHYESEYPAVITNQLFLTRNQ